MEMALTEAVERYKQAVAATFEAHRIDDPDPINNLLDWSEELRRTLTYNDVANARSDDGVKAASLKIVASFLVKSPSKRTLQRNIRDKDSPHILPLGIGVLTTKIT